LGFAGERLTERVVDRFTAVSESVRQRLLRERRLAPGRVATIHNGIEVEDYDPSRIPAGRFRRQLGLGPDVPLVGGIGNLEWLKGFDHFLAAAVEILSGLPQARFVIVGDGPDRAELEGRAQLMGLGARCIFAGFQRDIPSVLADLDVFVLSSVREGLPMVLLESMAMQRPIVATCIDGVPEVLTHGETGWLVPPADAWALADGISRFLADPDRARQMGRQARQQVAEHFTVQQMIRLHEKLYNEV
jgi:glycosyltransferase involved in cell wall biosynthesis